MTSFDTLLAISPIDGRYAGKTRELSDYFSEQALMKYRIYVEVEWFIHLLNTLKLSGTKPLAAKEISRIRDIYAFFDTVAANRVKEIEAKTNHDVKAIEYFVKENLYNWPAADFLEFVHFGCTSEDINNLAYSLMVRDAIKQVILPHWSGIIQKLEEMAKKYAALPMMALTHGQTASPTTLGKELKNVAARLARQFNQLEKQEFLGKFNGAVGNFNAHVAAYPKIDWPNETRKFVEGLGLSYNSLTTQIEPHDFIAEICHNLCRANTIVLDFDRDIWLYISRGVFKQKVVEGEVGSSTMPHKINPIDFENSEGNLGLANALFVHFANKLPQSRLQRDLTDSTVLRNVGVAFAHSILAYKSTLKGISKLEVNKEVLKIELDRSWEVLGEAVQTVLRKNNIQGGYELMKNITRGKKWTEKAYLRFVGTLDIEAADKRRLLKLTPASYLGLGEALALND